MNRRSLLRSMPAALLVLIPGLGRRSVRAQDAPEMIPGNGGCVSVSSNTTTVVPSNGRGWEHDRLRTGSQAIEFEIVSRDWMRLYSYAQVIGYPDHPLQRFDGMMLGAFDIPDGVGSRFLAIGYVEGYSESDQLEFGYVSLGAMRQGTSPTVVITEHGPGWRYDYAGGGAE